jgi:DNA-directed RNA polymerase specialized sigma24 family protein
MDWEQLYPIVKEQADYAVLRYDDRRQDKVQELVCQAFEKYQSDLAHGREIKKQSFKCFVTQRSKQLDIRSVVKGGYGGTSRIDVLGYFNRRPNSQIFVTELEEWMPLSAKSKEAADEALVFNVDYSRWINRLNEIQRTVVSYLIQGFRLKEIAEIIKASASKVKAILREIQERFAKYFQMDAAQAR